MIRVAIWLAILTALLITAPIYAQDVPAPETTRVADGITYHYWSGDSLRCSLGGPCRRMHAVTVDRNHPEYELRVLAAEDSATSSSQINQRQLLTRTTESLANESVPQAIIAINGAVWRSAG